MSSFSGSSAPEDEEPEDHVAAPLQDCKTKKTCSSPYQRPLALGHSFASDNDLQVVRSKYGPNRVCPDERRSYLSMIFSEASSSYFYAFQVFSQLLWVFLDSYLMTCIYLFVFLVALLLKAWYMNKAWGRLVDPWTGRG